MSPSVLFVQVPCFYAEVERAREPSLRARAIIVGGDPRKRGLVQSACPEALAAGVLVGEPMWSAVERCPSARVVRTDMKLYREVSVRLRRCLRGQVASIEPLGLDAAFLEIAAVGNSTEAAVQSLAVRLQGEVREETGLPLRVGIAAVKFLARLAAEDADASGIRQIPKGQEAAFLAPLKLERLPGVGPRTVSTLEALGALCVSELLRVEPALLEGALGNHGLRILEFARGEDSSVVRGAQHPRSLSKEQTFSEAQLDIGALWETLQELAQGIEAGLRREQLVARRVGIKLGFSNGEATTRSRTLARPVAEASEIYSAARVLLERTQAGAQPVRRLGIAVSGFTSAHSSDRQLDLFSSPV